jgi:hypothetical protein
MVNPPTVPHRLIRHWLDRHLDPVSFFLHMIGIPPTILGVLLFSAYVVLVSRPLFLFAVALFAGGYALQFAGHAIERTDPGEVIFFKRKLGLSYVEFPVPRTASRRDAKRPAVARPQGS